MTKEEATFNKDAARRIDKVARKISDILKQLDCGLLAYIDHQLTKSEAKVKVVNIREFVPSQQPQSPVINPNKSNNEQEEAPANSKA